MVSTDVKQHVYSLTGTISVQTKIRQVLKEDYNGRIVNLSQPPGPATSQPGPEPERVKKDDPK